MRPEIQKCYRILRLPFAAERDEIRRAYRRLALKYHPDKNPGQEEISARRFTAITRAYSMLMDRHDAEPVVTSADAVDFFKRQFFSLAQRLRDEDADDTRVDQEECDFFFRYQIEEVRMVQRGTVEARRILSLMRKAISRGYDPSGLRAEHKEFFDKHGFGHLDDPESSQTRKEIRELLWENPTNAESHYQLGVLYERRSRLQEALHEYRLASYLAPKRKDIRYAIRRLQENVSVQGDEGTIADQRASGKG